jgi:HAD superfamily hydrolase (TIGR01509 family)
MPIWESVAGDYLISLGITPNPGLYSELLPLSWNETAKYLQVEYGVRKSTEEIYRGTYGLLEQYYFNVAPLKDGVMNVLETFKARGIKMCVATATERHLAEPALRRCGVLEYSERIFTCPEEETHKSDPDIYIRAASFLGTDIGKTLVVEDALYAIKSAKRAGFPVAAIYDLSAAHHQEKIKEICDYYMVNMGEMLNII